MAAWFTVTVSLLLHSSLTSANNYIINAHTCDLQSNGYILSCPGGGEWTHYVADRNPAVSRLVFRRLDTGLDATMMLNLNTIVVEDGSVRCEEIVRKSWVIVYINGRKCEVSAVSCIRYPCIFFILFYFLSIWVKLIQTGEFLNGVCSVNR